MGKRSHVLGMVIAVSALVAVAGLGYVWVFSNGLGNIYHISPSFNSDSGIQGLQLGPLVCDSPGVEKSGCPHNKLLCDLSGRNVLNSGMFIF